MAALSAIPGFELAVFFLCAVAVFFNFAGYLFAVALIRKLRPLPIVRAVSALDDPDLPPVAVVIPVRNEETFIRRKLENVLSLAYPDGRVRVLVVDGGSTDGTGREVAAVAKGSPREVRWIAATRTGKIPQLNEALAGIPPGTLVVVTDADSFVSPEDALLRTAGYLRANPDVALVGGWTTPPTAGGFVLSAEHAYWDKQNRLRYLETDAFSSSIIVAPYYAFPRELLDAFPEDCIADDVFAAFRCHLRDRRVLYAWDIEVVEERCARTFADLYTHKRRKAHAYTIEILRVMHRLPSMRKRLKLFWGAKLFQFFYLPFACLGLAALSLHFLALGAEGLLLATALVLALSTVAASLLMSPPPGRRRGGFRPVSLASSAVTFALMFVVLIVNFFTFPFRHQDSSYTRLPQRTAP